MEFFRLLSEAISGLVRVAIGSSTTPISELERQLAEHDERAATGDIGAMQGAAAIRAEIRRRGEAEAEAQRDRATAAAEEDARQIQAGEIPKRLWADQSYLMDHLSKYAIAVPAQGNVVFSAWMPPPLPSMDLYINQYFNLGPREIAVMQPKIVIRKDGRSLRLTTLEDPVTAAVNKKRPSQIALKSMTAQMINLHMAFTKVNFTLELYCSDMATLKKSHAGGFPLIDLLRRHPAKSSKINNIDQASLRQQSIEAEFGWHVPLRYDHTAAGQHAWTAAASETVDKIAHWGNLYGYTRKQALKFKISILKHDIKFNKDGSLNLTLIFQGTFNAALKSPTANVLFHPDSKIYKGLRKSKAAADMATATAATTSAQNPQAGIERDAALKKYELQRKDAAPKVYKQFFEGIAAQGQFYTIDIPYTTYEAWIAGRSTWVSPPTPVIGYVPTPPTPPAGEEGEEDQSILPPPRVRRVTFFPLGALLNILCTNSIGKLQKDADTKTLFKNYKVRFGNISFFHNPVSTTGDLEGTIVQALTANFNWLFPKVTPQVLQMNLSQVPVSLELFRAWMIKFVISGRRVEITLDEALKDMVKSLILGFTSQSEAVSISPYMLRITGIPLSGGAGPGLYFDAGGDVDTLLLKLSGQKKADQDRGIYHFKPLKGQAVLKDFSFNRIDMKHVTESYAQGSLASATGIVRSQYKINLKLLGNVLLQVGQRIFIDASALIGDLNSPDNQQLGFGGYYGITSVTHNLSEQGFDTNIEARWLRFGRSTASWSPPVIKTFTGAHGAALAATAATPRQERRLVVGMDSTGLNEQQQAAITTAVMTGVRPGEEVSAAHIAGAREVAAIGSEAAAHAMGRRHRASERVRDDRAAEAAARRTLPTGRAAPAPPTGTPATTGGTTTP